MVYSISSRLPNALDSCAGGQEERSTAVPETMFLSEQFGPV